MTFKYFNSFNSTKLVEIKRAKLSLELEVHIPEDIVKDDGRYTNVKEGILRSMRKGLYEQGIDFRIVKSKFEVNDEE